MQYLKKKLNWVKANISLPANIYIFKLNNRKSTKRREINSKLTIKTPERCQWRRSVVLIVNSEHISRFSSVSTADFEHVFVCLELTEVLMQLMKSILTHLYPIFLFESPLENIWKPNIFSGGKGG